MTGKQHYVIQVDIFDIKVSEKYYSFKYHVVLNGQAHTTATYSDSHSRGDDIEAFRRALSDGWALEQVCGRLQFSY